MGLFYKNNGAISVFLCLILLPVLLFSGMTVDASRIFMAKVVVSDAGEMAMNAGLAQYNEELHDEYGLLVMDQSPEAMSGDLEKYFSDSLNGSELPDAEDYQEILDLLESNFKALSVSNTEIFQTEVEKQQILEYMKYRAPVCLTELVLEKINQLKDTKLMADAMEAEMDFVEDMEDCQDAFEEALKALDALNDAVKMFQTVDLQSELDRTQSEYKTTLSKSLLMYEYISQYASYDAGMDLKSAAESYINAAKKLRASGDVVAAFNDAVSAKYYWNTVEAKGGIDSLLSDQQEGEGTSEDSDDQESGAGDETDDREELESIVSEYRNYENTIDSYLVTLDTSSASVVNDNYEWLNPILQNAQVAAASAATAYSRLKEVRNKLEDAAESFTDWDQKTQQLAEKGKDGGMSEETDKYRDFFNNGNGSEDLQLLDDLMEKVSKNEDYFNYLSGELKKETFYDCSLAEMSSNQQLSEYQNQAKKFVQSRINSDSIDSYTVNDASKVFAESNYNHITLDAGKKHVSIADDPFYERLKEYCKSREETDSEEQEKQADQNTQEANQAAKDAGNIDTSYPTYNWDNSGVELPSQLLESNGASEANDALAGGEGNADINNSQARRDAISNTKNSIAEASNFLEKVDQIVAEGLENLYIAEYAMQMFSYYTVDKKDGESRPESEVISISGYPLKSHAAYLGECEYILWGNAQSQNNVRNTVMMIFGIRMLFNSFFALSNQHIRNFAYSTATAIVGAAPYLIPIVQVVIQLGLAGVETASDISKIKQGYGVTIVKDERSWATFVTGASRGDNTSGVTLDYSEYLRVFLNISILAGYEKQILARIADCIQVNKSDISLSDSYTMISVSADIKVRTTFMRKISDWTESDSWGFLDDYYTMHYDSFLGY